MRHKIRPSVFKSQRGERDNHPKNRRGSWLLGKTTLQHLNENVVLLQRRNKLLDSISMSGRVQADATQPISERVANSPDEMERERCGSENDLRSSGRNVTASAIASTHEGTRRDDQAGRQYRAQLQHTSPQTRRPYIPGCDLVCSPERTHCPECRPLSGQRLQ